MSEPAQRASRWFWALRPDKMLFGPIFAKEVIVSGRRTSTYWTRGLFALLIALMVSVFIWGNWDDLRDAGLAQRLQAMQEVGPILAWVIVWSQFVVITLVAPALTASCISEESANRTLSSLMTTPMTSAQIVLGKLTSRMVQLIILGLLTLPALLLLRLLGGLETEAVLAGSVLTMAAAFFAASVGLMLSVVNKRPWSVMVLSVVITLAYFLGPIAIFALYMLLTGGAGGGANFQRLFEIMAHLSPALALAGITANANGAGLGFSSVQLWTAASGASIILGSLICLLAVSLTRKTMRAHMRGSVRTERKAKRGKNRDSRISRTVSDDPVIWLEMRSKWLGNKWIAAILGLIVLGFLGWIFYLAIKHQEWRALHYAVILMLGIAQALMAMVSTTSRIASERQKRTWDVLMTTPLPSWRIVMGKLMAGIVRLLPVPIILLIYFSIFSALGMVRWFTTFEIVFLVTSWTIFLGASGLFWSSMFRRSITASVVNMLTSATIWIGAPMFTAIVFGALFRQSLDELFIMRVLMTINPWYLMFEVLDGGIPDAYRAYDKFPEWYNFMDDRFSPIAFLLIVLAGGGAALFASFALVVLTSIRARAIPRSR